MRGGFSDKGLSGAGWPVSAALGVFEENGDAISDVDFVALKPASLPALSSNECRELDDVFVDEFLDVFEECGR